MREHERPFIVQWRVGGDNLTVCASACAPLSCYGLAGAHATLTKPRQQPICVVVLASYPTRQGFHEYYGQIDHIRAHDYYPHVMYVVALAVPSSCNGGCADSACLCAAKTGQLSEPVHTLAQPRKAPTCEPPRLMCMAQVHV